MQNWRMEIFSRINISNFLQISLSLDFTVLMREILKNCVNTNSKKKKKKWRGTQEKWWWINTKHIGDDHRVAKLWPTNLVTQTSIIFGLNLTDKQKDTDGEPAFHMQTDRRVSLRNNLFMLLHNPFVTISPTID